jgi:hypothetical protein
MDKKYPNSKFILTIRDTERWLTSVVKHFGKKETYMRKWIYGRGCPLGNEQIYKKRYETHNKEVKEYFKSRPQDLLILDLSKGSAWNELCTFLGCSKLTEPFPHLNKASDRTLFKRLCNKSGLSRKKRLQVTGSVTTVWYSFLQKRRKQNEFRRVKRTDSR